MARSLAFTLLPPWAVTLTAAPDKQQNAFKRQNKRAFYGAIPMHS